MVEGDSRAQSEPQVGVYSMNVGKLSAVVDEGVGQLDEFDFVFFFCLWLHNLDPINLLESNSNLLFIS